MEKQRSGPKKKVHYQSYQNRDKNEYKNGVRIYDYVWAVNPMLLVSPGSISTEESKVKTQT